MKLMRRFISAFLALVMCGMLCVPAFASGNNLESSELTPKTPKMTGILTSEDGECYTIQGTLVSTDTSTQAIDDSISATYRYMIYRYR